MSRRWTTRIFAIALLFFLVAPLSSNEAVVNNSESQHIAASFESKNILFDESHCADGTALWTPGNVSLLGWMLRENGYNSSTNFNESLDSGILSNYDILVIVFPMIAFTAGELTAIESFVSSGGSLLLVGVDSQNFYAYRNTHLNALAPTFGITFRNDRMHETISSFGAHNITEEVSVLYPGVNHPPRFTGCSLSLSSPAISVLTNSTGEPVIATSEYGSGRVVAVGMLGPFLMFRRSAFGGESDSHFQFSLNVFDWLARNPQRTVNEPEVAVIRAGNGPDLTPSEVEEYATFAGLYHDHTTHSDGSNTPEEMLHAGLEAELDFMIMTDHSHATPVSQCGITGALAMRDIVDEFDLDIQIVPGAELSSIPHTTGFPLTSNIFTTNQTQAVQLIHAQGGIAVQAHPAYHVTYMPAYEMYDEMGMDAIEVDNSGYVYGGLEDGLYRAFLGACDGHSEVWVGHMINVLFVKNPTGPDGTISDADIIDAVLDRRVVIIDKWNDLVYGQKVWVDRYLELMQDAETAIDDASSFLAALGGTHLLSEAYFDAAQNSFDFNNPQRAIALANNATSSVALELDVAIVASEMFGPGVSSDVAVELSNNHTYPVETSASAWFGRFLSISPGQQTIACPAKGTASATFTATSDTYGLAGYDVYLHSFNTTEYLMPIRLGGDGIIDNVTYVIDPDGELLELDVICWIGRADAPLLQSVTLFYDDGTGLTSVPMLMGWDNFEISIGPYDYAEITFYVRVVTRDSTIYNLSEHTVTLGTASTTTPTTSTTTTTIPPPDITMIYLVAGVGVVIIIIVVVVIMKKK